MGVRYGNLAHTYGLLEDWKNALKAVDSCIYFYKSIGKKQQLKLGQPYTWRNNWRTDAKLFGGWSMWYFIGITSSGEKICGYQKINTTNNLLNQ